MGLDDFMDLDVEEEDDDSSTESTEPEDVENKWEYDGEEELVEFTIQDVRDVLEDTPLDFTEKYYPSQDKNLLAFSKNGKFRLVVQTSIKKDKDDEEYHWRDALTVRVVDDGTGYNVLEPSIIFRTEGWEQRLKDEIQEILDSQDELVYCDSCGSVMIIRRTNTHNKKIRGCSNYPDCRNKEDLE